MSKTEIVITKRKWCLIVKKSKLSVMLVILFSCSLIISTLTGCQNQPGSETLTPGTPSESPSVSAESPSTTDNSGEGEFNPRDITEGVTLAVAVPEVTRISDWDNNEQTLKIEEKFGVELAFEVYPSSDFTSKINAMVMGGDTLPDLIMKVDDSYANWAAEGALLELSEYYANPNLAPNIQLASVGAGYDIATYMKDYNGNIYAFPRLEQAYGMESWQRFWIYKPWLDEIGKDIPKTIDEFYEIAKLVAVNDMNGNGDTKDEYIITGYGFNVDSNGWADWFEPLMNAYIYAYDSEFRVVEDGEVSFAFTQDEWKEGLHFIKKFFDEGLIGSEIFTNTDEERKAQMYQEIPTVLSFCGWIYEGPDPSVALDYVHILGLTNANGENGESMYMPRLPSAGAVISADCENPEAAFLISDYLCSVDISLMTRYGKEGLNWTYWDDLVADGEFNPNNYIAQGGGEISWLSAYKDTTYWSSQETTKASWLQVGPFIRNAALQKERARLVKADSEEEEIAIQITTIDFDSKTAGMTNARKEVYDYAPISDEELEVTSTISPTVRNYVAEMTSKFLLGREDIDSTWDSYIAELEKMGANDLLKIYQDAYSRTH